MGKSLVTSTLCYYFNPIIPCQEWLQQSRWWMGYVVSQLIGVCEKVYPPGNQHIPPLEKENHLPKWLGRGYVSSQEGMFFFCRFSKRLTFWHGLQGYTLILLDTFKTRIVQDPCISSIHWLMGLLGGSFFGPAQMLIKTSRRLLLMNNVFLPVGKDWYGKCQTWRQKSHWFMSGMNI